MALENIADLLSQASRGKPKSIIIPGGDRPEDIEVFKTATQLSFINRCILTGDHDRIAETAEKAGVRIPKEDILATGSQEESADKTVELVQTGEADIILKGNISTPVLNRRILQLAEGNTISLCTLFQSPLIADNRPMLLTDAGVTTDCNYARMSGIIRNAGELAHRVMGLENPRVALLSANEKVIPSLKSSVLAQELSADDWGGMTVYGPLSFDLATSLESLRLKGLSPAPGSPMAEVAGRADILVCPGLDSANILYKAIMALSEKGQAKTAGITMGVKVPYIILSRADNAETKINSLALCALCSEQSG